MASRKRIRSKQHAKRRKEARRRRRNMYIGITIFVVLSLIGLTHWGKVQIKNITADTGPHISEELVTDLTRSVLSEPYFSMISRNNILLLPRQDIRRHVLDISPRIKSAEVDVTGLRSVAIEIINRQADARACQPTEAGAVTNCHLVDDTGYIFASTDTATSSTDTLLTYIIDSSLAPGTTLLPQHRFQSLNLFIDVLADIGMYADEIRVREYGDVVIPAREHNQPATSTRSVDLKVNFYDDLSQVASNLQTVIENESFVTAPPSNGEPADTISPFSLEYIDLRFENKVFYK